MPHNYHVLSTNPKDPKHVKEEIQASARQHGGTGRNTIYFDRSNKRAYAFCGFPTEAKARSAVTPMAKELGAKQHGVVVTASELGLR
jgi:hypothetical protein